MGKYRWRRTCIASFSNQENMIEARVAFKTQEIHWVGTRFPVIAIISTHSAFHEGVEGDLKMNAFISTIKSCTGGGVTILFAEKAHLHALSLRYKNDLEKALQDCKSTAEKLSHRYQPYLEECNVIFCHTHICQDRDFESSLNKVENLYNTDPLFQKYLYQDAKTSYTPTRKQEFPNENLFIEKTVQDIMYQCVLTLVFAEKGYRFQFYPGRPNVSTEYANQVLIPEEKRISWINVFLSIEKKKILNAMV